MNDDKAVVDLDAAQPQPGVASDELVRQLAERARVEGLRLTGEGGLLSRLTKVVVESALDGELDDHLGYSKHDPAGRDGGNSRNGKRAKTVLTEARSGIHRGAARPRGQLRSSAGQEAPAAADRARRSGDLVVGQGINPRRDLRASGRGVRGERVEADHIHD